MRWQKRPQRPWCVLIVDPSDDNREVLATALTRHGIEILQTPRADHGQSLLHQRHPDLVVLDAEAVAVDGFTDPVDGSRRLVALGSWHSDQGPRPAQVIAKPYHYAPLIRKIVELLDQFEG